MFDDVVPLDPHRLREVAVCAECAPATVRRFLAGLPIRQLSRRRIERALAELGQQDHAAPGPR